MRKSLFLVLKNSIKNTFSNLSQLFGMTMLVVLLAVVITLMTSISTRVLDKHSSLITASNQHNIVLKFDPFETATVRASELEDKDGTKREYTNNIQAQQALLNAFQAQYQDSELAFDYSRTEGRDFSQTFNDNGQTMTLKAINKLTVDGSKGVDNLVISEGRSFDLEVDSSKPNAFREIVLDSTFAKTNNIALGTIIRLQLDQHGSQFLVASDKNGTDQKVMEDIKKIQVEGIAKQDGLYAQLYSNFGWFQVVGLGNAADFMAPIINQQGILPNRETEGIVYVSPAALGLFKDDKIPTGYGHGTYLFDIAKGRLQVSSNTEWESFYNLKTKSGIIPTDEQLVKLNNDFRSLVNNNDLTAKYVFGLHDKSYRYANRTRMIESTIKIYNLIAMVILLIVLGVALYAMGLITRKQIEKSRSQIGVLKALGYRKRNIVLNFITTPLLTTLIGGAIGYLISVGLQEVLIKQFSLYFSLDFAAFSFDWLGLVVIFILMWLGLTGIAFLIAWLILRHSALSLINANKTAKIGKAGLLLKKLDFRQTFSSKMRTALLIDASGKMFGVGTVVLFATFLMTMSYIAPSVLTNYKEMSYNGINYNQLIEYAEPQANNPYTFLKTYNKNSSFNLNGNFEPTVPVGSKKSKGYAYSKALQGYTGLPTNADGTYDVEKIIKAYLDGDVSAEFFAPFVKTTTENINSKELSYANARLLAGANVALSNSFFKFMVKEALPMNNKFMEKIIWGQLSSQWPDRTELIKSLKLAVEEENLNLAFEVMKNFYIKYIDSVALAVSKTTSNEVEHEVDRIENLNDEVKQETIFSELETLLGHDELVFENLLDLVKPKITTFKTFKMNLDHSLQFYDQENDEREIDFIRAMNQVENEDDEQVQILYQFLIWYGSLFAFRADEAIIQAAYSRAPYYVKQYMKKAWNDKNYAETFNVINYDKTKDQLGTLLNASIDGLNFKIYGLDEANKYMQLFDENQNNLLDQLITSKENEIVINQTIAKKLNLKNGDLIDANVIQNQLQLNQETIEIEDWTDKDQRKAMENSLFGGPFGPVPKTKGFMQQGVLNPLHSIIKNKVPIYSQMRVGHLTTPLTDQYRAGNAAIVKQSTQHKFKIVGVHNQYGTPAAWINNNQAKKILGYDKVEEYLWANQFIPQWGDQFENKKGQDKSIIFTNYDKEAFKTLSGFKARYLEPGNIDRIDGAKAQKVLQLFVAADPVFNYKYSIDTNIGDLESLVTVWTKFGDYNPTTMNGGPIIEKGKEKIVDGIGQSAFGAIVPIQTSKEIIHQISQVIMSVLVLIIILVLVITFTIILLTTSLIITDNARFISTMKVLGYSNYFIAKNILGMYLIVIFATFAVGFGTAYGSLILGVKTMMKIGIVLPFAFVWWLLPAVILSVMGIYAVTLFVGFRSISKLNATRILQSDNL